MFCHTGSCPTDLTDLHGFVFLGLSISILTQISLITLIVN